MLRRPAPIGFALAFLMGALSCAPPEVRACEDFVDALRACTDRNGEASGPGEDDDYAVCEAVDPACESFFECAAAKPCADDLGFYTISTEGCEPPEGVRCL
jgi:hypothetical protein